MSYYCIHLYDLRCCTPRLIHISAVLSESENICKHIYVCVFQLAGTAVFAIGLWLRLDPKTKGLFEGPDSPYVFYTGNTLSVCEHECCLKQHQRRIITYHLVKLWCCSFSFYLWLSDPKWESRLQYQCTFKQSCRLCEFCKTLTYVSVIFFICV